MNKIPADDLFHINVVVGDARASAEAFSRIYGISSWKVIDYSPERLQQSSTHGFLSDQNFLTATGAVKAEAGDVNFRLIQPLGGWTTYQEFLLQRGPGIHSVCTGRLSKRAFHELEPWLARENIAIAQSAILDGNWRHVLLDTRQALGGFYVELEIGDAVDDVPADDTWHFELDPVAPHGLMPLNTGQLHLGVVVHDLIARIQEWRRLFGVTQWSFTNWHTAPGSLEAPVYMGQPVDHAYFTTMLIFSPKLAFEIIQPTFGPSHYRENFRDHVGEGIHHINTTFFSSADDWIKVRENLGSANIDVVMGGGLANDLAHFYYLDTQKELGFVSEALHPGDGWSQGFGAVKVVMTADLTAAA
jgi:hypothetical protein